MREVEGDSTGAEEEAVTDLQDLATTIAVVRAAPRYRRLVCPACHGSIALDAGQYVCQAAYCGKRVNVLSALGRGEEIE